MKEKRATKNVLSLSPNEAFDFLMKSEHFHEFAVGKTTVREQCQIRICMMKSKSVRKMLRI